MTRMIRICDRITPKTIDGNSDAKRKFSYQFEQMFNDGTVACTNEEFEKLYVHDRQLEQELEEFSHSTRSMTKFLVGYTGIGKSTTIRHCFSIGLGKAPKYDAGQQRIVFPSFLDGIQSDRWTKDDLCRRVRCAIDMMFEEFPELAELLRSTDGKREFHEFVKKHTPFAIHQIDPIDELDLSEDEKVRERLRLAYEQDEFTYTANELKFLIYKKYDVIRRLIIIVDDFETHSDAFQEDAIVSFLKLHECMKNTTYPEEGEYTVNLLIGVRPHTYRRHAHGRRVESFGVGSPIVKLRGADLDELFQKRFDFYTGLDTKEIAETDNWDDCYTALMAMNSMFGGQYRDMIARLNFYDVRKTLSWYAMIFANRQWVQNNMPVTAAFSVTERDYRFNNVTIIRALACRESEVYTGAPSNLIPNILLTTPALDESVLCLTVLKYFVKKTGGDEYGLAPDLATVSDVLSFFRSIFGEPIESRVCTVIDYLFKIKVLRRSIRRLEETDERCDPDSLLEDDLLYASPLGIELYGMLARDSLLIELLREAAYRDYDWTDFSDRTSYELLLERKQADIYIDLLKYVSYLCEKEDDLLMHIDNNEGRRTYEAVLSGGSVCSHLLEGIRLSIRYSGIAKANPSLNSLLIAVIRKAQSLTFG